MCCAVLLDGIGLGNEIERTRHSNNCLQTIKIKAVLLMMTNNRARQQAALVSFSVTRFSKTY